MSSVAALDREQIKAIYDSAAERYLRELPLEHFMESAEQARQREITVESFALIRGIRPDVHVFNELLIEYPRSGDDLDVLGQVVPDNMVVVSSESIKVSGSYHLTLQPAGPILVLEYVSKNSKRKDYVDNFRKYQDELHVPYHLLFNPIEHDLRVHHLVDEAYVLVPPNPAGRLPIPELELEAGLFEGWVRFWFRGNMLALPEALQEKLWEAEKNLAQKDEQLAQKDEQLAHRDEKLTQTAGKLVQTEVELTQMKEKLSDVERQLQESEADKARMREELALLKAQQQ